MVLPYVWFSVKRLLACIVGLTGHAGAVWMRRSQRSANRRGGARKFESNSAISQHLHVRIFQKHNFFG
jgi:hypothetical protein